MANYLQNRGQDPAEAVRLGSAALQEALRINPQDWAALNDLGFLLAEQASWVALGGGDPTSLVADAKEAYRRSLTLNQSNATALVNRASAERLLAEHALKLGQSARAALHSARDAVAAALAINPNDAEAHMVLGRLELLEARAELKSGRSPGSGFAAAAAAFKRSLSLYPDYPAALCGRAQLARDRAAWLEVRHGVARTVVEQGLKDTAAALAVNSELAEASALEGELRLLLARGEKGNAGNAGKAAAAMTRALAINPRLAGRLTPLLEEARRLAGS